MIPYSDFVRALFKTFDALPLTLHHATTGMMGEIVEVATATDRADLIAELGDFEFYLEALMQNLPVCATSDTFSAAMLALPQCLTRLYETSGDLLDLTKKLWVYNEPLAKRHITITTYALRARMILNQLYMLLGTNRDFVIKANMAKLMKRYPNGGYSDHNAQTRPDGAAERHV